MPKVSIAMRTRNDAPFVEKTIKAILSQSFSDFELLAFDNASTDGTREILEKFPQIKIFDIPEGKYIPGKVLNFAASKCEGEVVVFNNADAVVENRDWLKNLTAPPFSAAWPKSPMRAKRPEQTPTFGWKETTKRLSETRPPTLLFSRWRVPPRKST